MSSGVSMRVMTIMLSTPIAAVRKPWTKRYVVPRATRVFGSKVDDTSYSSLPNEQMRIHEVLINLKAVLVFINCFGNQRVIKFFCAICAHADISFSLGFFSSVVSLYNPILPRTFYNVFSPKI